MDEALLPLRARRDSGVRVRTQVRVGVYERGCVRRGSSQHDRARDRSLEGRTVISGDATCEDCGLKIRGQFLNDVERAYEVETSKYHSGVRCLEVQLDQADEALRSLLAAVLAVWPISPDDTSFIPACRYCGTERGTPDGQEFQHNEGCAWVVLKTAIGK